eukprot:970395-Rhodomonas_salina.1
MSRLEMAACERRCVGWRAERARARARIDEPGACQTRCAAPALGPDRQPDVRPVRRQRPTIIAVDPPPPHHHHRHIYAHHHCHRPSSSSESPSILISINPHHHRRHRTRTQPQSSP